MKITERQLRSIIREVIAESYEQELINEGATKQALQSAVLALMALGATKNVAKTIVDNLTSSNDNFSRISVEQPMSSGPMNVYQKHDEEAEALSEKLSKMSDEEIDREYTKSQIRDMLTQIIHMKAHGSAGMGSPGQKAQPEVIEKLERILGNEATMYTL